MEWKKKEKLREKRGEKTWKNIKKKNYEKREKKEKGKK